MKLSLLSLAPSFATIWVGLLAPSSVQAQATNISAALTDLCSQMPGMPGCTLMNLCAQNSNAIASPYCSSQSLFTDICVTDGMGRMSGCSSYNSTCSSQTSSCVSPSGMPTSQGLAQQIYSICTSMSMTSCQACPTLSQPKSSPPSYSDCDMFTTYFNLCKEMPGMQQCAIYSSFCSAHPEFTLCQVSTALDPPTMKMYFHTGILDYVLFESWVPRTTLQYIGYIVATLLVSFVYEGIVAYSQVLESQWNHQLLKAKGAFDQEHSVSAKGLSGIQKTRITLVRGGLRFLTTTLGYSIMLITMTFNYGLFFAVIFGLVFGTMVFGQWSKEAITNQRIRFSQEAKTQFTLTSLQQEDISGDDHACCH
ncbi:Ctr copper transporter family-domain-containing protein [Polychytrium aggregatum]|uniref:Ctr copper transporter family-domain-containing protein n=1 Tax=Polychytrium aggregatum TaxID=110093 RepID=UPI0022FE8B6C|nr:Ctr copper transporter family-domain-containing protein [Polychytrium aggregatum]KAI9203865.1 Ctr copper transporter family-domain-containing protein [Polychytrium aggregatum]